MDEGINSNLESKFISPFDFKPSQKEIKGILLLLGYFGIFLIFIGIVVLLPLIMLIFYHDEANMFYAFLIPGLIALVIGISLYAIIFKKPKGKLTSLEDLLLVIGVWIFILLFSAFPLMFYGYSFTQALFESTSGYTTAGISIMNWAKEIEVLEDGTTDVVSHMLFFHRALMEVVGGTGLVLIVSSAISERSNLNLYLLEGHSDKLLPNLAKSARLIFSIYLAFIVIGTILYLIAGVKPFDAICHAMTAVATGGFSTKANNINTLVFEVSLNGAWRGVLVEIITEILMVLGGVNFVIHYSLIRGKFNVLKHFEFIVFIFMVIIMYPITVIGMSQYYGNVLSGFRYGTFDFISAMSTAGFQSIDSYQSHYVNNTMIVYPSYLMLSTVLIMCVGMQSGSTCGGIKQSRIGMIFLNLKWRIESSFGKADHYRVKTTYKFGNKVKIEKSEVTEAETYVILYVTILLIGSIILSMICSFNNITKTLVDGSKESYTLLDCFFEFASCIGNNGLSSGLSNYSTMPAILWIELIGMFLGRLELFVFITLGGKIYQRIKSGKHVAINDNI